VVRGSSARGDVMAGSETDRLPVWDI
jgi:predicted nucleotidyltransferase